MADNLVLKTLSNQNLIEETKSAVSRETLATTEVINYLSEVNQRKAYLEFGYGSLISFCVRFLKYSEPQAYRRIEAMKLVNEIPEVAEKLKSGALNLTTVAMAASAFKKITTESMPLKTAATGWADEPTLIGPPLSLVSKKEILKSIENKSSRECQKELQTLLPDSEPLRDSVKAINKSHLQVTLSLSNETYEKLQKLKNRMSHSLKNMSDSEMIEKLVELAAARAQVRRADSPAPKVMTTTNQAEPTRPAKPKNLVRPPTERNHISVKTKRELLNQAADRCMFVADDGTICEAKAFLEIDHIIPKAHGGSDHPSNLRILCRNHNQFAAIETLGEEKMGRYLKA